ncbi:unnamed protein product [marine sediment metagenome]|uniref:Uncharacterized protein n=1 Tax=marine sediment metagenome TaxID=412755 RepID=X1EGI2_9ZZZZ
MSKYITTIKYGFGNIPPRLLGMLINPIGYKAFKKLSNPSRYIYIIDQLSAFRQEMCIKYGSASNYTRHWLEQKGMTKSEYCNELARRKGYKNQNDYLDKRYQLKGFKGKADNARFYRLRKKYPKSISDFVVREIQLKKEKMEVKKELEHFIIIRKSIRHKNRADKLT